MAITISTQPTVEIQNGGKLFISASAQSSTGTTLVYKWKHNNVLVPKQTSSFFLIPISSVNDSGTYSLIIYEGTKYKTANIVTVFVKPTPITTTTTTTTPAPQSQSLFSEIVNTPQTVVVGSSSIISIKTNDISTPFVTLWEVDGQQPKYGNSHTLLPTTPGIHWIEAETTYLDGRRLYAAASYKATEVVSNTIEIYNPDMADPAIKSWYKLNGDFTDSKKSAANLTVVGYPMFDSSSFKWANDSSKKCLYLTPLQGVSTNRAPTEKSYFSIELMINIKNYNPRGISNTTIVSLYRNWDDYLSISDDMWIGPSINVYGNCLMNSSTFTSLVTTNTWHHMRLLVNNQGYYFYLNGIEKSSFLKSNAFQNWIGATPQVSVGGENSWMTDILFKNG